MCCVLEGVSVCVILCLSVLIVLCCSVLCWSLTPSLTNPSDGYAQRLEEILARKQQLVGLLQKRLKAFRRHLQREEAQSRALSAQNISNF
jgi:hypothetical protein